ncbi:MAG: hypothetical protein J5994_08035 [Ruminococcus sp.]|nr:hypothetical protein [Ruminococcus sp.]
MEEMNIFEEENTPMVSYFWKGLALFLLGVLTGIVLAPVKKGVSIGNNNNIVGTNGECCCDQSDEDNDEDEN